MKTNEDKCPCVYRMKASPLHLPLILLTKSLFEKLSNFLYMYLYNPANIAEYEMYFMYLDLEWNSADVIKSQLIMRKKEKNL